MDGDIPGQAVMGHLGSDQGAGGLGGQQQPELGAPDPLVIIETGLGGDLGLLAAVLGDDIVQTELIFEQLIIEQGRFGLGDPLPAPAVVGGQLGIVTSQDRMAQSQILATFDSYALGQQARIDPGSVGPDVAGSCTAPCQGCGVPSTPPSSSATTSSPPSYATATSTPEA
ncbi:hypothetical protein GCM10027613_14480 [Microlunatus endophyticus]